MDVRYLSAQGKRQAKPVQPSPGNHYDLLACLADVAAAVPCGPQCGDAQRPSPSALEASEEVADEGAVQSEWEVRVICNGNFGTFLLPTQTVLCHCARCDAAAGGQPGGAPPSTITPTEFERHSGLLTAKKWRNSIRLAQGDGTVTIGKWLEQHNILPRPKCTGGPFGSPAPIAPAHAGARPYGAAAAAAQEAQGYLAGHSFGAEGHGGGAAGIGGGRMEPSAPVLRSTLPPSRYPASEFVTGEEDDYREGAAALAVRGGGGAGAGADSLRCDEVDDEDYYCDSRPYGADAGGDGYPGRGGRRAVAQRGGRGGANRSAAAGVGRSAAGRQRGRQAGGAPRGGARFAARGSSSQDGGPSVLGGHSSSEGSPPSPSDDSKRRGGSGGSGDGDGSGTGCDGGESRLPVGRGDMDVDAELKHEEGGDPHGGRRPGRHQALGGKPPPAQYYRGGRDGSADGRASQERSARHAGAVKRMPPEYLTGADISPAIKRARSSRPYTGTSGGAVSAAAAAASELTMPYDASAAAAAAAPEVRGWCFMEPAAGPAAEQVLMSVSINGRTFTGILTMQQAVPPLPPLAGRPPLAAPHASAPNGGSFVAGPGRRLGAAGRGVGPVGRCSLPPLGQTSRLGVASASAAAAEVPDGAAAVPSEDEPFDDGMPADCPRCALCHRCATPVLTLPPPPPSPRSQALAAAADEKPASPLVLLAAAPDATGVAVSEPTALQAEAAHDAAAAAGADAVAQAGDAVTAAADAAKAGDEEPPSGSAEADADGSDDTVVAEPSEVSEPRGAELAVICVKQEEAVKGEDLPAAEPGPVAAAAVASTTVRQTGAGLGPLVGIGKAGGPQAVAVHSQCALWCPDVFMVGGTMFNVQDVVKRCRGRRCARCGRSGATLSCCNAKCGRTYHLPCAMEAGAALTAEPFSMACPDHAAATHSHASASGAAQGRSAAGRPRLAPSPSADASQLTSVTTAATTVGGGGDGSGSRANGSNSNQQSVYRNYTQPQQQVELPASLQQAAARRIAMQAAAMPPPSALPPRAASCGGAPRGADASGLPALMMLRGQPGAAGGAVTPPPQNAAAAAAEEESTAPDAKRQRVATPEGQQAAGGAAALAAAVPGDGGRAAHPPGLTGVPSVFAARAAAADGGGAGGSDDNLARAAAMAALQQQQQQQLQHQQQQLEQGAAGGGDAAMPDGLHALLFASGNGHVLLNGQAFNGHAFNGHELAAAAAAAAGGGDVTVDCPFFLNARGLPGAAAAAVRQGAFYPQAAPGGSGSTGSGSTVTTLGLAAAATAAAAGGGGGDESPSHLQAQLQGGMAHVLPRAARGIEGLLPSRPLLHNPYVPNSGDPSADLTLSRLAQNGTPEAEAELLGGTTGRAGHTGRCAVCVIQRKGKCGTESAPKKCLRRQLTAVKRANESAAAALGGNDPMPDEMQYAPDGGADGGADGGYAGVDVGGVGGADAAATPYMDDRVAVAAAELRARERARRETWSLPLGQGSGASGKRPPHHLS